MLQWSSQYKLRLSCTVEKIARTVVVTIFFGRIAGSAHVSFTSGSMTRTRGVIWQVEVPSTHRVIKRETQSWSDLEHYTRSAFRVSVVCTIIVFTNSDFRIIPKATSCIQTFLKGGSSIRRSLTLKLSLTPIYPVVWMDRWCLRIWGGIWGGLGSWRTRNRMTEETQKGIYRIWNDLNRLPVSRAQYIQ